MYNLISTHRATSLETCDRCSQAIINVAIVADDQGNRQRVGIECSISMCSGLADRIRRAFRGLDERAKDQRWIEYFQANPEQFAIPDTRTHRIEIKPDQTYAEIIAYQLEDPDLTPGAVSMIKHVAKQLGISLPRATKSVK